jgi:hypothetical protein
LKTATENAAIASQGTRLSQPMVQSHPTDRAAKARRRDTHDASASAEVVVGPRICLYWERDGRSWPV